MKITRLFVSSVLLAAMAACGGGSGGGSGDGGVPLPPPPPPASATYSVALTNVEIDRAADQDDIMVDGLPVDGATVTVDD